jgi:hypothetical protein
MDDVTITYKGTQLAAGRLIRLDQTPIHNDGGELLYVECVLIVRAECERREGAG